MSDNKIPDRPEEGIVSDAWRAAILAYRKMRQQGYSDHPASHAARSAVMLAEPGVSTDDAGLIARTPIAWASRAHKEWFWKGVKGAADYEWPVDRRKIDKPYEGL